MLSQHNIDIIKSHGPSAIYRCEPMLDMLPSYKRDDPYWCKNWTFRIWYRNNGTYWMYDTYYDGVDEYPIELTDDNFDKFEYLFDMDKIQFVNTYSRWIEYPETDRWYVGVRSAGREYLVRQGAQKNRTMVIERLRRDIESMKREVARKERELEGVINWEIDWNYV